MKALLRVVLIIVGLAILIFSALGVFWPWDKLVSLGKECFDLSVPTALTSPITVYIFRAMCVTYVWAGFLFLLCASNPVKYLALIRSLALASLCVGLTCILVGVKLGLPIKPVLFCDGIPCMVAGILIWTLSTGAVQKPEDAAPPAQSVT